MKKQASLKYGRASSVSGCRKLEACVDSAADATVKAYMEKTSERFTRSLSESSERFDNAPSGVLAGPLKRKSRLAWQGT